MGKNIELREKKEITRIKLARSGGKLEEEGLGEEKRGTGGGEYLAQTVLGNSI